MTAQTKSHASVPPASIELGRYRLVARLAQGGMGDVYLAVCQGPAGFSKLAVIKELRSTFAEEQIYLSMFLDEARLAARLNHANVVQTNEVGSEHGRHYLVMEYLEGQPLARVMQRFGRDGAFPMAMQLRVIAEALRGLHYAHEVRDFDGRPLAVVHRDFTPHNVFVTYDGVVKVVDFGIAKAHGSQETRTGVVKGKAAYMAPEQAIGQNVDRRADIYSAGVMLWEAATGQRMWPGMTDVQILLKTVQEAAPSPRYVNPHVPADLARIIIRALARDPVERYGTAAELRAEVESFLDGSGFNVTAGEIGALVANGFVEDRKRIRGLVEASINSAAAARDIAADVHLKTPTAPAALSAPPMPPAPPLSSAQDAAMALPVSASFPDGSSDLRGFASAASVLQPAVTLASSLAPPELPARVQRGMGMGMVVGFATACVAGVALYFAVGRTVFVSRIVSSTVPPAAIVVAAPAAAAGPPSPTDGQHGHGAAAFELPSGSSGTGGAMGHDGPRNPAGRGHGKGRGAVDGRGGDPNDAPVAVVPDEAFEPSASPLVTGVALTTPPVPAAAPATDAPVAAATPTASSASPVPAMPAVIPFAAGMARPTLLSGHDPEYTREARLARVEGTMVVKCTITTAGVVERCRVLKNVPLMEDAVLEALRSRRYTPVYYSGHPTAVDYVFNVQLVLPR